MTNDEMYNAIAEVYRQVYKEQKRNEYSEILEIAAELWNFLYFDLECKYVGETIEVPPGEFTF